MKTDTPGHQPGKSPKKEDHSRAKRAQKPQSAHAPADKAPQTSHLKSQNNAQFPVVGIGASAGGLEAFTQLMKALPDRPGLALVLVPHLDPKHESAMTDLLARTTSMPVLEVKEGLEVQANHAYVIPPNTEMTIQNRVLRLKQRGAHPGPYLPIDIFLRSLALDLGSNAIAVILSGIASDGTLGVAAIKSEGGITFAQDPQSAKYDGMPNSAIASGFIDVVLPPEKIGQELTRIREHPYVADPQFQPQEPAEEIGTQTQTAQVFRLLKQVSKIDFSDYKPGTIRRRLARRMALNRLERLDEYVKLLRRNPKEIEALCQDILINVTSFFRDPEMFEALKEVVYPSILKGHSPAESVRIWVPGCSTGEEAYAHAMALVEYTNEHRSEVSIQVFGTDLSEAAVARARTGGYSESIRADVTPERLRRFFNQVEGGYQISKSIRDMCVFARQNVFNDPPFSRMDIVSCRNVLIYMSAALQRRVIPIFHYALNPAGFLVVGNTEGLVGTGAELFELADKKHKIYRKKLVPSPVFFGRPHEELDAYSFPPSEGVMAKGQEAEQFKAPVAPQREADRLLLTRYVPAAVLVNQNLDVLQTRGHANRYLELPSGRASLNLLKMAKAGLLYELQNAIEEAKKTGTPVRKPDVRFESDGNPTQVNIEIIPIQAPLGQAQQSYVIVFEDGSSSAPVGPREAALPETADQKDRQIAQFKQELAANKEYLQSIIEAQEASNEELQSANEEIQSGNEELQSTNEELQTSKEELESANEELKTVNEEMENRNRELTHLNNDLINLLASVNIPIMMLGSDLSLRRFTPPTEELLGLTAADLGRSIGRIRLQLAIPRLQDLMLAVLRDVTPRELEVKNHNGRVYLMRLSPYRTLDNEIDGVVVTFFEVGYASRSQKSGGQEPQTAQRKQTSKTRKR